MFITVFFIRFVFDGRALRSVLREELTKSFGDFGFIRINFEIFEVIMYQMKSFARAVFRTAFLTGIIFRLATLPDFAQNNLRASGNIGIDWMGGDLNHGLVLGFYSHGIRSVAGRIFDEKFRFPKKLSLGQGRRILMSAEYGGMYAQDASVQRYAQNSFGTICGGIEYRFLQNSAVNPVVFFKAGVLFASNIKYVGFKPAGFRSVSSVTCGVLAPGFGIEYITKKVIYNARLEVLFPSTDQLDGYTSGHKTDGATCVSIGAGIPF